ncbi:MAG: hypothetical protein KAT90_10690 [Gammaproteobacteria bacterium]|nr:hypothetical protein [Gammaproteobacteria bacterium]
MFNASPRTLKLLASLIWYSGFIVLFIKSSGLLLDAESIKPNQLWTWLAVFSGLLIGAIKARYLYSRLCIKNLNRINALKQPKLWNFYRMRFFFFLFSMIILGKFLSRMAHDNYPMLLIMAIVELSVATALLGSSHCFWITTQNNHQNTSDTDITGRT